MTLLCGHEIRTVTLPDYDDPDETEEEQVLVVWPFEKDRPTDQALAEAMIEDRGDDD